MKKTSRILAAVLAAMFLVLMLPISAMAAETYEISEFDYGYWGPKDTPLLVILVNFDPSLNGEDLETGEMLLKHQDHSYWSEMFFGNGPKGMKAYFEIQSGGNFRFIPAQENYENAAQNDKKNDGVIEVSVPVKMSSSTKGSTSDPERYEALAAAVNNGYVDFSVYDKDGNGFVGEDELMVAFVTAGYEYTRATATPSYNAHESSFNYGFNGVKVSTDYVKCGEMINDSTPLTVGSFCHELGHALGNGDLYAAGATSSWGGENSPAGKVSVMAGNGSSGANDGEAKGTSPSNFDPYHLTVYGLYDYSNVGNGEYTLYSRQSKKGTYNILKISTPDPNEYYLIENRYFDDSTPHFDSQTNYTGTRGVIIWHVDQGLADAGRAGAGMRINSRGTNADIGVAALSPATVDKPCNPASSGVFNAKGLVFDCHAYEFPGSGTWYTSMTDEEAALFDLHIEILDDPGHEMKIKVTGVYEAVSPRYSFEQTSDYTTITCKGQITDLNNQVLTSMTLEVSDKEDFSNILQTVSVKPDDKGYYEGTFEGLAEGTYYYTRVTLGTQRGDFSDEARVKTAKVVEENTTEYNINFYKKLDDKDKAYGQKAKVGEPIVVKFPMKKTGYVFAGWYTDAEYTEYFEVSNGKADYEDIDLHARWVKDDTVAKLTVVGAKLVNEKVNPAAYAVVGETFREPVVVMEDGKEFIGWYADEALTTPFDFEAVVENTNEVKIYAKWKSEEAETTTGTPEVVTTTGSAAEATTTGADVTEPTGGDATEPADAGNGAVIGIVIAVVAVVVIAVVVVLVMKKKK